MRRIVTVPAHQIRVGDKILSPEVDITRDYGTKVVSDAHWDPADHTFYIAWGDSERMGSVFSSPSAPINFVVSE